MHTTSEENRMELGPEALNHLNATRKWTMFLSVLGFIFLGLLIVAGIATNTFLSAFKTEEVNLGIPESFLLILFIVISVIYFFPVFYLFRFSRSARDAVQNRDIKKMEKALKNLRIYFTYIGVMAIIVISIYLLALAAGISSMSFLKGI
jgi:hypothetical protein